jgi:hypothetical protein
MEKLVLLARSERLPLLGWVGVIMATLRCGRLQSTAGVAGGNAAGAQGVAMQAGVVCGAVAVLQENGALAGARNGATRGGSEVAAMLWCNCRA